VVQDQFEGAAAEFVGELGPVAPDIVPGADGGKRRPHAGVPVKIGAPSIETKRLDIAYAHDVVLPIWIGARFALALAVGFGVSATSMIGKTVAADDNPADWPSYYRDNSGWRYSPLKQITTENVKDLKVAWLHQPGDILDGLQSTPIVVDGVIYYIAANNNVFAVNGKTGETIWHYQPRLNPMIKETFWAMRNRGITVGHGMVYIGSADGRHFAIDQKTGKEQNVHTILPVRAFTP
jgi:hypothetical protein